MPPEERAASESSIESDEETDKEDDALDKYWKLPPQKPLFTDC